MSTDTLSRPAVGPAQLSTPPPLIRGRLRKLVAGRDTDPRWARPALVLLLAVAAVLYLWGLGASGWANSFYSAAVQAGTKSWKAFFFGASDAAGSITIDKPPAALWVMELSARIFGLNSWSILVPQALEGVATVALLYATVRRWFGVGAGLLAGAVLAVTPVAVLMFRFNNPDALLVLFLVAAAYAVTRALEGASTRWLVLAGALVGAGFLTKMLQALLVVPAFAVVYLLAAPTPLRRRLLQLAAAGVSLVVSGLWWVVAVMAVPAASRPYIGGSQNNSLWNLIFGYNGFGRLTGNESGSIGGGTATGSRWGLTGLFRMLNTEFGGQTSWLLPAAGILLAAGLVLTWRRPRTDRTRAALVLWGGWLVVTVAVFSFGRGIIHPYYAVALAPAIGAVVGIGSVTLWARRGTWVARGVLSVSLVATAAWSYIVLDRTPGWFPWLRPTILAAGIVLALFLLVRAGRPTRLAAVLAGAGMVVALAAPSAFALNTVAAPHQGAIPAAGPGAAGGFGPGPGGVGPAGRPGGLPGGGRLPGGFRAGPGGFTPPAGFTPPVGGFRPPGGIGGLLNGSRPSAALVATLEQSSGSYTWVAATIGSNQAAGYQLATSLPVMPIGGFNGTDPSPTLAAFQHLVQQGKIHYFIPGGGFGGGTTASTSSQIASWVESHFTSRTVGGATLYDLTAPVAGS